MLLSSVWCVSPGSLAKEVMMMTGLCSGRPISLERKQEELKRHPWCPVGRNQDNPTLLVAQAGCLLLHLSGSCSVCLL